MTAYDSYNPENSRDSEDIIFHNSEDFIILDATKPKNVRVKVTVYSKAKGSRSFEGEFNVETLTLKDEDGKILENIMVISEEGRNHFNNEVSKLFRTDGQLAYGLKAKFANLEHGYAITSHKAQGSTYKNVYTMEDNIMGPSNRGSIKAKNQSLYVAVSRPTDKLVMVSSKNAGVSEEVTTVEEELPSGIETGTEVTGDTQAMFGNLATELGDSVQAQPSDMQQSKLTITEEQLKTINDNLDSPFLLSMDEFNAASRAEQEKLMHCLK